MYKYIMIYLLVTLTATSVAGTYVPTNFITVEYLPMVVETKTRDMSVEHRNVCITPQGWSLVETRFKPKGFGERLEKEHAI